MSVRERTREIGTMRALGMRRSRVVRLFVLEGMALGVVSAVAGALAGGAVVAYLAATGIPMKAGARSPGWPGATCSTPPSSPRACCARSSRSCSCRHWPRLPGLLRQPPRAPGGPPPCVRASPAASAVRCSLGLFALGLVSSTVAAAPPDAATILRRADRAILGEAAAYTLRMTVVRPEKPERVVEMKGWKKGDEQGLVRYTAPAKERGTAYLRSGESTWLFLPSAEKVVRVGAKQNFGGGDFSNADIFRLSLVRDYDPTLAGEETVEGEACYKLELKAKDRSVAYDRVVYWVRSDGTFYPVKADYYTLSGKNLKSLVLSQVKPLGGRPRPTLMTMQSRVDEGSRTRLEFLTIQDDPKLDDRLFSPGALERGE